MIPVNEPLIAPNAPDYVSECLRTGWISSAGEYIGRFERSFASYLGVRHAITTTSGTTALHTALAALGLGPGDDVLIPDLTMIAVPYAVLYTGATPVFLDVDPEIFGLDPARVREFFREHCVRDPGRKAWINRLTGHAVRAVLPVHLYGHPCAMEEILAVAREFDLVVVEDAAEAHGALVYPGGGTEPPLYAGTMGRAGCFSFYANKILTTGEGGMVVTDDEGLADRARRLKDLAHAPGRRFLHTDLAFNYRMTNVQAAIGLAQLERIDDYIGIKLQMAKDYAGLLAGVPGLTLPRTRPWARNVFWMYAVLVEPAFGMSRDGLAEALRDLGVDTRTFFLPVHSQPVFRDGGGCLPFPCPVSEDLAGKGLYLPSGLAITREQIEEVCAAVRTVRATAG